MHLLSDAVSNPEEDEELQRIGVFGLCNNALGKLMKEYAVKGLESMGLIGVFVKDRRVQQRLASDKVIIGLCKHIILTNTKYASEFLLTTVCLLWHICTPENINCKPNHSFIWEIIEGISDSST